MFNAIKAGVACYKHRSVAKRKLVAIVSVQVGNFSVELAENDVDSACFNIQDRICF
jgi:hypothetical protein